MKSIHWLLGGLVGMAAATTVLAQSTNKPAAKKPKTAATTNASAFAKDTVLETPMQAKVKNESLNVRDEPTLTADVVARLSRGEMVTIFEQMTVSKPKAGEPAGWSRISLPTNAAAWVFAEYVDAKTMKTTRRLNVRGGPGENFKSLVLLDKGAEVTEIKRAQGWIQILPPSTAFGFVASEYLMALPTLAAPAPTPPVAVPPPTTPVVTEPVTPPAQMTNSTPVTEVAAQAVAPTPVPAQPAMPVAPPPTTTPAVAEVAPAPTPAPSMPVDDGKPRVVTREGFVRKALNIQAPTDYELMDVHTGAMTEYLQPTNASFKSYTGYHVTVTGPEALDSRWPKTPVLQVQTVQLIP
jgi:uncharacterized protein YgiM (DUF1202 family)